jgi:hypothetical protein
MKQKVSERPIIRAHIFIYIVVTLLKSRDSEVGIATSYGLEDRGFGVRVPVGSRIFSTSSRPALGPLIQWVPGALSPGVKQPGREADHSSATRAEVKKTWIYRSTPPYTFTVSKAITLPYIFFLAKFRTFLALFSRSTHYRH